MDRHVRAIVSHRLPNAKELETGCDDWLECCQAYIHAEGCSTTKPQSTTEETPEPPNRISINPATAARYPIEDQRIGDIEYARVDRKYFCSCGAALTAEEYITHYFDLGHDRGDPAVPASVAPVVDDNDAEPLTDAEVDAWLEAHKNDPVDPAQVNRVEWLFRKKLAASVIDKATEWLRSYDERIAQGGKGAQDMERLYGKEAAFHREVIRAVETLALEPRSAAATAAPQQNNCPKCGGSGEIEIGCAMDHALTAPCVECGGSGHATAAPVEQSDGYHEGFDDATRVARTLNNVAAENSLLAKIATICDLGSAEEFGDALERLQSIRRLIDEHEGAR